MQLMILKKLILFEKNAEFYADFMSVEMSEKLHPKKLLAENFCQTVIEVGKLFCALKWSITI